MEIEKTFNMINTILKQSRTMKKLIVVAIFLLMAQFGNAETLPRKEYPRPQFEREQWINLNGTWV